jgi:hypothetical protein
LDLEEKMKRLLTVLLAGLLIAAFVVPAAAWEFSMKGEYEMRLRYISRTGDTDLFGVAPTQDAIGNPLANPGVGFAGPNWYNRTPVNAAAVSDATATFNPPVTAITGGYAETGRGRIVRGGYSRYGCDALYHDSRLTLRPVIRVNPAIRVFGVYTVGGMRHKYFQNYIGGYGIGIGTPPFERYYVHQTSDNAYDTAALGSWEQFRATIQTPLFIMSIGVKDFPFGTGLNASYETRAESFLMVAPYGPFRFLWPVWLARSTVGAGNWTTVPDKDTKPTLYTGGAITYDCGALNAGALNITRLHHTQAGYASGDGDFTLWGVYAKYNNGRFFAAAEYGWINIDSYPGPQVPGSTETTWARPAFIEVYQAWAEVGAVAGPAKVRLAWFQASGDVLNNNRGGSQIAGVTGINPKRYSGGAVNYQVARPYQYLMFETYAGGSNTFHETHGYMADAYAFAGRADYAVASNLNMWATYMWAHRLEVAGAYKGGVLSSGAAATAAQRQAFVNNNFGGTSGEVGGTINPYVDDGFIGWEAQVGMDWKILEGLTWFMRYSYWQPGEWFEQAYQSVGWRGGIVDDAYVTGKDAIHAIQGSFYINF